MVYRPRLQEIWEKNSEVYVERTFLTGVQLLKAGVADPDPHNSVKLDPNPVPHYTEKLDPDPHYNGILNPDPVPH